MSDKNKEISPEFLEAIKKWGDCPEDIFKLAKTDFEKAVAVEFFKNEKEHSLIIERMDNVNKLVWAILGATGFIGFAIVLRIVFEYILHVPSPV